MPEDSTARLQARSPAARPPSSSLAGGTQKQVSGWTGRAKRLESEFEIFLNNVFRTGALSAALVRDVLSNKGFF